MPTNIPMTPIHTKNNSIKIIVKKYTYKSENVLMIPFYAKKIITLKSIPINLKKILS